jgi:hypothetical protein
MAHDQRLTVTDLGRPQPAPILRQDRPRSVMHTVEYRTVPTPCRRTGLDHLQPDAGPNTADAVVGSNVVGLMTIRVLFVPMALGSFTAHRPSPRRAAAGLAPQTG